MSVQRRVNQLSQMREDVPDLRAIESAASGDFDTLIQGLVTGAGNPYIVNGFDINFASTPIGSAASNLQVIVSNGSLLHTTASQSGTFYLVPAGTPPVTLNAATVSNVSGSFVPSSNNYVGIDYYRFQDPGTDTQRYLWDPTSNEEDQAIAPAAIVMNYEFVITPTIWADNILPIAIVTTDSGNNVTSITDSRPLLFRLGTGGASPNPFNTFNWSEGTTENPTTSSSNSVNPFFGGDRAITDLKDFINAVETGFLYLGGGPYWYSFFGAGIPGSLPQLREDVANTILTGNGNISHGVIPDTSPTLSTTGDATLGNNQLTNLASTTGLANGQYISGEAFPAGTTVQSFSGSTVVMSTQATDTVVGTDVYFTNPVSTQPGQINWSNSLHLKIVGSNLDYQITANPTGNTVTLTDGQVAYIELTRDTDVSGANLIWTNGSNIVTSVGAVSWTSNLVAGDWIKLTSATHAGYYKIQIVNSTSQVTLSTNFTGTSTGPTGASSQYAFGVYTLPGVTGTSRDIQIVVRGLVPTAPNDFWLFSRNDDGGALPRVYIKWLGMDLAYGVSENVSGPQIENLLQYVGSPFESSTYPKYVSAYSMYEGGTPAVLPQITSITTASAATMSSGEYFLINSSADARQYAVWVKKDGSGSQPAVANVNDYIEWDVTTGQTASQTATTLVTALDNILLFKDFTATAASNILTVTNNSSGSCVAASNISIGGSFSISTTQSGTGQGNYIVNDADNLTLAIKKIDLAIGNLESSLDSPTYDEIVSIVASGAIPPNSLNGPISSGTNITLPNNSREGNVPQLYTVGKGTLMVFYNGQFIDIESGAYTEVGSSGAPSSQIQIQINLDIGDELEFRLGGGGGGGGGGGVGPVGPAGPAGPAGPSGADAANGPVNISTKTSDYVVLSTDGFLLADCSSGPITFTLPPAATSNSKIKYFKKVDSSGNSLTIQGNGAELIDGSNTVSTSVQYESFSTISDGSQNWLF